MGDGVPYYGALEIVSLLLLLLLRCFSLSQEDAQVHSWWQLANPGSPGKMTIKQVCVCVCVCVCAELWWCAVFVVAFMQYYDNIGGSIPAWLINWAAKVKNHV